MSRKRSIAECKMQNAELRQRDQLALVTRLVTLASGVPLDYPVTLTAGELRVLLHSLANQATARSRSTRNRLASG